MTLEYKEIPFDSIVDESVQLLGYDTLPTVKNFWRLIMRKMFAAIFNIIQSTDHYIKLDSRLGGGIRAVYEISDGSEHLADTVDKLASPKGGLLKQFLDEAKRIASKGYTQFEGEHKEQQFVSNNCALQVVRNGRSQIAKVMELRNFIRLQRTAEVYKFKKPIGTLRRVEQYKMEEADKANEIKVHYKKVSCYLNERNG